MKFDNIFLIGMMGSGKSVIGKLLSKKMQLPLLDIDNELETIMQMSITQIFNDFGENRFRLIESTFFKECTKLNNCIYATGGGIVIDKNNQSILKNRGVSIFLDCSADIIIQRIKNDIHSRPLLSNNYKKEIKQLYKDRFAIYKSCSEHIIDTSDLPKEQIVKKITEYLNA